MFVRAAISRSGSTAVAVERQIGNRCDNLSKIVVGMAPTNQEVLLSNVSLEDLPARLWSLLFVLAADV